MEELYVRKDRRGLCLKGRSLTATIFCTLLFVWFVFAQAATPASGADCGPGGAISVAPQLVFAAGEWAEDANTEPITPNGTDYFVETPGQLAWVAKQVNGGNDDFAGKRIVIAKNLDMSAHDWTPIGVVNPFKGSIEGHDHMISNLKTKNRSTSSTAQYVGLVGNFAPGGSAGIVNVHLRDVEIKNEAAQQAGTGGIVGQAGAGAFISGCSVQGDIEGARNVGGIAGNFRGSYIRGSHVLPDSQIESGQEAGGIAGRSAANIEDSSFYGDQIKTSGVGIGGIVGIADGAPLSLLRCHVATEIKGASRVGGIAGGFSAPAAGSLTIQDCTVSGSVKGWGDAVGGILGAGEYSAAPGNAGISISRCTNTADVKNDFDDAAISGASYGFGGIAGLIDRSASSGQRELLIDLSVNRGKVSVQGEMAGTPFAPVAVGIGGIVGGVVDGNLAGTPGSVAVKNAANLGEVAGEADTQSVAGQPAGFHAGGIGGLIQSASANDNLIENAYNGPNAKVQLEYDDDNGLALGLYAGGIVGRGSHAAASSWRVRNAYNAAKVRADNDSNANLFGYAGGLAGELVLAAAGTRIDYFYSNAPDVEAAGGGGAAEQGIAGTGLALPSPVNEVYFNDLGGALADTNFAMAGRTGAFMSSTASFAAWTGQGWQTATAPPTLAFAPVNAVPYPSKGVIDLPLNGTTTVRLAGTPAAEVGGTSLPAGGVWDVVGGSQSDLFATFSQAADGTLTIQSNGTAGVATLGFGAPGSPSPLVKVIVGGGASTTPPTPPIVSGDESGYITAFELNGVPLTPLSPGRSAELDLGFTTKGGGAPNPAPQVDWGVSAGSGSWIVEVVPDGVGKATLRVREPETEAERAAVRRGGDENEEFTLTVSVTQVHGSETVFSGAKTRDFLVGEPFETEVELSEEAAKEMDDANNSLAESDVKVVPGNPQPAIPPHILPDDWHLLEDVDNLTAVVESPRPEVLPVCFDTTGKQSVSITMDVTGVADDKKILIPMSYTAKVQWGQMRELFGEERARRIVADPRANLDDIFKVLVIHKQVREGEMAGWFTRLVRGVAQPQEALDLGFLTLRSNEGERSLTLNLSYYVLDDRGEAFMVRGKQDPNNPNSREIGYIVLPDGLHNGRIVDPVWLNRWKADTSAAGEGGGGGCTSGFAAPFAALLLIFAASAARRRMR